MSTPSKEKRAIVITADADTGTRARQVKLNAKKFPSSFYDHHSFERAVDSDVLSPHEKADLSAQASYLELDKEHFHSTYQDYMTNHALALRHVHSTRGAALDVSVSGAPMSAHGVLDLFAPVEEGRPYLLLTEHSVRYQPGDGEDLVPYEGECILPSLQHVGKVKSTAPSTFTHPSSSSPLFFACSPATSPHEDALAHLSSVSPTKPIPTPSAPTLVTYTPLHPSSSLMSPPRPRPALPSSPLHLPHYTQVLPHRLWPALRSLMHAWRMLGLADRAPHAADSAMLTTDRAVRARDYSVVAGPGRSRTGPTVDPDREAGVGSTSSSSSSSSSSTSIATATSASADIAMDSGVGMVVSDGMCAPVCGHACVDDLCLSVEEVVARHEREQGYYSGERAGGRGSRNEGRGERRNMDTSTESKTRVSANVDMSTSSTRREIEESTSGKDSNSNIGIISGKIPEAFSGKITAGFSGGMPSISSISSMTSGSGGDSESPRSVERPNAKPKKGGSAGHTSLAVGGVRAMLHEYTEGWDADADEDEEEEEEVEGVDRDMEGVEASSRAAGEERVDRDRGQGAVDHVKEDEDRDEDWDEPRNRGTEGSVGVEHRYGYESYQNNDNYVGNSYKHDDNTYDHADNAVDNSDILLSPNPPASPAFTFPSLSSLLTSCRDFFTQTSQSAHQGGFPLFLRSLLIVACLWYAYTAYTLTYAAYGAAVHQKDAMVEASAVVYGKDMTGNEGLGNTAYANGNSAMVINEREEIPNRNALSRTLPSLVQVPSSSAHSVSTSAAGSMGRSVGVTTGNIMDAARGYHRNKNNRSKDSNSPLDNDDDFEIDDNYFRDGIYLMSLDTSSTSTTSTTTSSVSSLSYRYASILLAQLSLARTALAPLSASALSLSRLLTSSVHAAAVSLSFLCLSLLALVSLAMGRRILANRSVDRLLLSSLLNGRFWEKGRIARDTARRARVTLIFAILMFCVGIWGDLNAGVDMVHTEQYLREEMMVNDRAMRIGQYVQDGNIYHHVLGKKSGTRKFRNGKSEHIADLDALFEDRNTFSEIPHGKFSGNSGKSSMGKRIREKLLSGIPLSHEEEESIVRGYMYHSSRAFMPSLWGTPRHHDNFPHIENEDNEDHDESFGTADVEKTEREDNVGKVRHGDSMNKTTNTTNAVTAPQSNHGYLNTTLAHLSEFFHREETSEPFFRTWLWLGSFLMSMIPVHLCVAFGGAALIFYCVLIQLRARSLARLLVYSSCSPAHVRARIVDLELLISSLSHTLSPHVAAITALVIARCSCLLLAALTADPESRYALQGAQNSPFLVVSLSLHPLLLLCSLFLALGSITGETTFIKTLLWRASIVSGLAQRESLRKEVAKESSKVVFDLDVDGRGVAALNIDDDDEGIGADQEDTNGAMNGIGRGATAGVGSAVGAGGVGIKNILDTEHTPTKKDKTKKKNKKNVVTPIVASNISNFYDSNVNMSVGNVQHSSSEFSTQISSESKIPEKKSKKPLPEISEDDVHMTDRDLSYIIDYVDSADLTPSIFGTEVTPLTFLHVAIGGAAFYTTMLKYKYRQFV